MSYDQEALDIRTKKDVIKISPNVSVETREDLSTYYTPGIAAVSKKIAGDKAEIFNYTIKRNSVAVVSDGSAVLGLGNIGPEGALPVMEGKALLFNAFAGIDAWPICLATQDTEEIIKTVRNITPVFGGINLEDISAPRCFEIEERLQDLGIPVMHDDQHGTAVVVLAGLINALKVCEKSWDGLRIVISGAGAAGTAVAKIIMAYSDGKVQITPIDRKGALCPERSDLNPEKQALLEYTKNQRCGTLEEVMVGADVFIGVSAPGIVTSEMVKSMAQNPIVFAMANPTPEIMPDLAAAAGAAVVATGRSDFPNQINNVLAFPGIFRGALDSKATKISEGMKLATAEALADYIKNPTALEILPSALDKNVAKVVAEAVADCAKKEGIVRSVKVGE